MADQVEHQKRRLEDNVKERHRVGPKKKKKRGFEKNG